MRSNKRPQWFLEIHEFATTSQYVAQLDLEGAQYLTTLQIDSAHEPLSRQGWSPGARFNGEPLRSWVLKRKRSETADPTNFIFVGPTESVNLWQQRLLALSGQLAEPGVFLSFRSCGVRHTRYFSFNFLLFLIFGVTWMIEIVDGVLRACGDFSEEKGRFGNIIVSWLVFFENICDEKLRENKCNVV